MFLKILFLKFKIYSFYNVINFIRRLLFSFIKKLFQSLKIDLVLFYHHKFLKTLKKLKSNFFFN